MLDNLKLRLRLRLNDANRQDIFNNPIKRESKPSCNRQKQIQKPASL